MSVSLAALQNAALSALQQQHLTVLLLALQQRQQNAALIATLQQQGNKSQSPTPMSVLTLS
jgi:hypothetical protein